MDNKPDKTQAFGGGFVPVGMVEDLAAVQEALAPVEETKEEESIDSLKEEEMSQIRDILSKSKGGTEHGQSASEV